MTEPQTVGSGALRGKRVALSASESADLARLGLTEYHCRLVIAEVGRAIMLAGGVVVYGGDTRSDGYTRILIDQAQRYHLGRPALEVVLSEPVYGVLNVDTLTAFNRDVGSSGILRLVSATGEQVPVTAASYGYSGKSSVALTAMRQYVVASTSARVVVGGRLTGYAGTEPGVLEEARLTLEARQILLASAGYGGAGAAIVGQISPHLLAQWSPGSGFPAGLDAEKDALLGIARAWEAHQTSLPDELTPLAETLARSHRPGDIAACVVGILAGVYAQPSDRRAGR